MTYLQSSESHIPTADNDVIYRIGIDLGGTKTEIIVLDANGKAIINQRLPTPRISTPRIPTNCISTSYSPAANNQQTLSKVQLISEYQGILDHLKSMIFNVINEVNETPLRNNKFTIGIGIPGAISPASGLVKNANTVSLIGQPLIQDLTHLIDHQQIIFPIQIANDANCFTLSEAIDGSGKDHQSVFGVILGTGVGGGWAIDQRLIIGANAITGEWGHNPLPWKTPSDMELPCYCGQQGCIETFLSGPGLSRHARILSDSLASPLPNRTAAEWWQRYQDGDCFAEQILEQYCHRLAKGLASIINVIDPNVIVLGGGLSNMDILYQRIPQLWQQWIFSDQVSTQLLPPVHGDASGVRGAAWLGDRVSTFV